MENYSYNSSYLSPATPRRDLARSSSRTRRRGRIRRAISLRRIIRSSLCAVMVGKFIPGRTITSCRTSEGRLKSSPSIAASDSALLFSKLLPGEDLDALISVTNDDDLEHMMHEYERLYRASPKPARLRIFIFSTQNHSLNSSTRSFGSDEVKSEKERFVEALNSAPIMTAPLQSASPVAPQPQPPTGNADFLFGLEKANAMVAQPPSQQPMVGRVPEVEDPVVVPGMDERFSGMDPIQKHIQDLQRLRLEEQHGIYRRKSDDNLAGGFTGASTTRCRRKSIQWRFRRGSLLTDRQQVPGGVYPTSTISNEQPVYMMPPPSSAYNAPMMRQVTGAPTQGYYTVQRMPPEVYRDQQQQMYNMIPQAAMPSMAAAPQKAAGYSEGYGMVRQATTGGVGMVTEAGYAQMAYDSGMGRQVIYTAPGGVMGAPAQVQTAAQYQAMAGGVGVDMRQAGALNPETGADEEIDGYDGPPYLIRKARYNFTNRPHKIIKFDMLREFIMPMSMMSKFPYIWSSIYVAKEGANSIQCRQRFLSVRRGEYKNDGKLIASGLLGWPPEPKREIRIYRKERCYKGVKRIKCAETSWQKCEANFD
ncbi:hypothetical protein DH2020_030783 [Rehmannia glutinosa]|uniref:PB1 domain-containing protein n=1 Tax=Rehmannia glutinosa TaxID=99300 RepID=A0ABR0VJU4_REHGL